MKRYTMMVACWFSTEIEQITITQYARSFIHNVSITTSGLQTEFRLDFDSDARLKMNLEILLNRLGRIPYRCIST